MSVWPVTLSMKNASKLNVVILTYIFRCSG